MLTPWSDMLIELKYNFYHERVKNEHLSEIFTEITQG